jgi:signal transduction histidine kinase
MALLVGVALFVAQAVNFAFLLNERQARRLNFSVSMASSRLVDAVADAQEGRPTVSARRAEARPVVATRQSLVTAGMPRQPEIEARLASAFSDAGIGVLGIRAAEVMPTGGGWREPEGSSGASGRRRDVAALLVFSVQVRPDQWFNISWPLRAGDAGLVWRLLLQTAIIFAALLLAVLWIGRYAAKPLGNLTRAAAAFGTKSNSEAVRAEGPADIQRLIATFNDMWVRTLDMLGEKDRMLGAIGHDLRTPLASLRLRAENVEDDQERERMIATIDEMNRTLEDILALARLGRSSEPPSRVELGSLVDAVVEDLHDLGQDVSLEPPPRLPVTLRPVLTTRAVRNLIDNAVKYGGSARVTVRKEGAEAVIEIEDEGPGIPEQDIERMMDGFVRLETSRNRETGGTGLGLTIARSIVRDEGGGLRLENRAEGGFRAVVRLPIAGHQGS